MALCKKLTERVNHSEGPAKDGENYPAHLNQILELYIKIQPADDDRNADGSKKQNASVMNRGVQEEIIGIQKSLNPDDGMGARHSTIASNKAAGMSNVTRGVNSATTRVDSDSPDNAAKKKSPNKKRRPNSSSPIGVMNDHSERSKSTKAVLEGLVSKMSKGADPVELALKRERFEMDKDSMLSATKVEEDRVQLDREKFDFERESQKNSTELNAKQMNATINATQVSAQRTRIETLNTTLAGLTNTLGQFKDDDTMSNMIRAQIKSVLAKIQVETDNV